MEARGSSGKRGMSFLKLGVGSWNIGSLTGKSIKLVKSIKRRKINIACVQESKWIATKTQDMVFLWMGTSRSGVEVRRISIRMMTIKLVIGRLIVNVLSAYAPQVGLDEEVKMLFWEDLDMIVRGVSDTKKVFIGGDFNGHIGSTSSGFHMFMKALVLRRGTKVGHRFWIFLKSLS